jgi:two-component system nitrate/nitrite response regulator NarL
LLIDGFGTTEIAGHLFVADVTVRTHLAAIIRKLHVKDRAGLLQLIRGPLLAATSIPTEGGEAD